MKLPESFMPYIYEELDSEDDFKLPEDYAATSPLPTKAEARKQYDRQQSLGLGTRVYNAASAMPSGVYDYFSETWGKALADESIIGGLFSLDSDAYTAVAKSFELGTRDIWRLGKTIQQNIADEFGDLTEDEKFDRYYQRMKENHDYFYKVRPEYAKHAAGGKYAGDIQALADFLDPTLFVGGGAGLKVASKGMRAGAKGAAKATQGAGRSLQYLGTAMDAVGSAPLKVAEKMKGGAALYRSVQGVSGFALTTGTGGGAAAIGAGLTAMEITGKIAQKTGRQVAEVSRVFAQPSGHERFLFRLSTDEKVAPWLRSTAAKMHRMQGAKVYDVLFDGLASGIGAGSLQAALQFAADATDEQIGAAMGVGAALGSPMGMAFGSRGSGKSLEALDQQGQATARSQQTFKNYLAKKNSALAEKTLSKLYKASPSSAVMLTTLDSMSETAGVRLNILPEKAMQMFMQQVQQANAPMPVKSLPAGYYDSSTRVLALNEGQLKKGVDEAAHTIAHEIGHDHVVQMFGMDSTARRTFLESYEDPNGKEFYFYDSNGRKRNRTNPIKLNKQAVEFANEYAKRIQQTDPAQAKRIKTDAALLAEELAAEHFAMMFTENPNAFAAFNPQVRQYFLGAAQKVLASFGIIDPQTGAPAAPNAILKAAQRNKQVDKLHKNFLVEKRNQLMDRSEDSEVGAKVKPKEGQTSAERFTELFGGVGIDAAGAGTFAIKDQQMFEELKKFEVLSGADPDGKFAGVGKGNEGQNLHPEVIKMLINSAPDPRAAKYVLDQIQHAIDSRPQVSFGYRTGGKNGGGYNPFHIRNATLYGYQWSPKNPRRNKKLGKKIFPNLKVVGYNSDVIMHNIDVLANAGFIKDVTQFTQDFAQHSKQVFKPRGEEGRINPKGLGENELFTAAFGKQTADFENIQNPKLKQWLKDNPDLLKKSYVSYDLAALAGMNITDKSGFAFNYQNIKNNYMPLPNSKKDAVRYMPPFDDTPTPFIEATQEIRLKPYMSYKPTAGNMEVAGKLEKADIKNPNGTLSLPKIRELNMTQELEYAVNNGLLFVSDKLKDIDYGTEYIRAYSSTDPRRGSGNYLKDGDEYVRSSIPKRGSKEGDGETDGGQFVHFVHFPTTSRRRRVLEKKYHGSGIAGAEGHRRQTYSNVYEDRLYFGDQNYVPEKGLNTDYPHSAKVSTDNLWTGTPHYDKLQFLADFEAYAAKLGLAEGGNGKIGNTESAGRLTAFESFIKKMGFLGMYNKSDKVGFMFHDIEVGTPDKPTTIAYPKAILPEGRKYMPSTMERQRWSQDTYAAAQKKDQAATELVSALRMDERYQRLSYGHRAIATDPDTFKFEPVELGYRFKDKPAQATDANAVTSALREITRAIAGDGLQVKINRKQTDDKPSRQVPVDSYMIRTQGKVDLPDGSKNYGEVYLNIQYNYGMLFEGQGYGDSPSITLNAMYASRGNEVGQKAYAIALNLAHEIGGIYEPTQLTKINQGRVLSQMLSSALKFGTTKHFRVNEEVGKNVAVRDSPYGALQGSGMFAERGGKIWSTDIAEFGKNYNRDIAMLATKEMEGVMADFPELKNVLVDFKTGKFSKSDQEIVNIIKEKDSGFTRGVGLTTAKRAIITNTLGIQSPSAPPVSHSTAFANNEFNNTYYMPAFKRPKRTKSVHTQLRVKGGNNAGAFKGAPKWVNEPSSKAGKEQAYNRLVDRLYTLVEEGWDGRFWYEESGDEILKMFKGDIVEAEKFTQLIAIYSPQTKVDVNTYFAVRGYEQWANGFTRDEYYVNAARDDKALQVLYDDVPWAGRKTDNFYQNLMYSILKKTPEDSIEKLKIDKETYDAITKPVTIDMWVYRAFGYGSDALTDQKGQGAYGFAEREINRIAEELNSQLQEGETPYLPHQIQAMLWTSIKARSEDKDVKAKTEKESFKAGDLIYDEDGKRKFPTKEGERRHMLRWTKNALALPAEKVNTQDASGSFKRFLETMKSRVMYEVVPSPDLPLGAKLGKLPYEKRTQMRDELHGILVDENGVDVLAQMLGMPINESTSQTGGYEGLVEPNMIAELYPNKPKGEWDDDAIRSYARAVQYIYRQKAVPWIRFLKPSEIPKKPYYVEAETGSKRRYENLIEARRAQDEAVAKAKLALRKSEQRLRTNKNPAMAEAKKTAVAKKKAALDAQRKKVVGGDDSNFGVRLDYGDIITDKQLKFLSQSLRKIDPWMGYTQISPSQVIVVNFKDDTGVPSLTDQDFFDRVNMYYGKKADIKEFFSTGEYAPEHNWQADPEGGSLLSSNPRFRPDVVEWIRGRRQLSDEIQKEYGKGKK